MLTDLRGKTDMMQMFESAAHGTAAREFVAMLSVATVSATMPIQALVE
jgi:hypothetical protein